MSKRLEAINIANEVMDMYAEDKTQDSFNLLLLGEAGTGKSFMLQTARLPIHIDSFDRGGTKSLRSWAKKPENKGKVFFDTRFEDESRMKPHVFPLWETAMMKRDAAGYFNHLGTFVIDSTTNWSEAIMNHVLKMAGIPGQAPRFTKDYTPQKTLLLNYLSQLLKLPCDLIMTGHLEDDKDETTQSLQKRFMSTGKAKVIIPAQFDELWVMEPKASAGRTNYRVLTESTGRYSARSRLSEGKKLAQYEEANIKGILKKANALKDDLPPLLMEGGDS